MKKRLRLKKQYKILLVIVFILVLAIIIFKPLKSIDYNASYNDNNNELITSIIGKIDNDSITEDFLFWLNESYGKDTLTNLNNLLDEEGYNDNIWHKVTNNSLIVLNDLYNNIYDDMTNVKIINSNSSTISFIGDVSLADNWKVMPEYDKRNKGINGILSDSILNVFKNSDILVANNEFTVSNRGTKISKMFNFRANPERLKIYDEMGVNLVTLANNHSYDYGTIAFEDMINSLDQYQIPHIGAGLNIDEAMQPFYYILNGYKISFVNATRAEKNIVTPEATATSSGVFRCYDTTNMVNLIKKEKDKSDLVIALIHYGKEGSHELESVQVASSKEYIDAGADAIIGTHAHALQGIEFYNSKIIMYNLGDFIFNAKTEDTGIFQIKLDNDKNLSYYFYPALQKDVFTDLLEGDEKTRLINDMNSWSINATINENGEIMQTN
jgi:poly-gamma-glutamate synthesis protein (capsule biosynthesis protein)